MSDTRTDTARNQDDSEPDAISGGPPNALDHDAGSRDDMTSVTEPDGLVRATTSDDTAAGVAEPDNRSVGGDA